MKATSRWTALAGTVLLMAACGGSRDGPAADVLEARRQPLQAQSPDEVELLFDWAQRQYPELFPGLAQTQAMSPWRYRHYPQTGNYVGVADGQVAVYGPLTGGSLLQLGSLAQFRCQVSTQACTRTSVTRIQGQGFADFGLTDDGRLVYAGRTGAPLAGLPLPEAVPIPGTAMMQVASGVRQFEASGMYLDTQGSVFAWGSDITGWIGGRFGNYEIITKPRKLPWPGQVQQIAFSGTTAIALLTDGTVWKLPGSRPAPETGDYSVKPAQIPGAHGIRLLGRGGSQLHVVGEGGVVLAADGDLTRFTPVPNTRDVVALSCGGRCLGIQSTGRVIAWGAGPLGDGLERGSSTAVTTMLPAAVVQVAANGPSGLALTASGELWAWGGDEVERWARPRVVPVHLAEAGAVIDISCGPSCLLRRSDGSVWQLSISGLDAQQNPLPIPPMLALPGLRLF